MDTSELVGGTLTAGLVTFLVGAAGWRMAYERPLPEALPVIHRDRRRRFWIHTWMTIAMFVTPAGLAGFAVAQTAGVAQTLAVMAATVYAMGAVLMLCLLAFRLMVVPWAAEQTATAGTIPSHFASINAWAGALYCMHMAASYAAYIALGAAVLASDLPTWLGWFGIGWGAISLIGIVATRFAGPFNPPFLAHMYPGVLGVVLLLVG